MRWCWLAGGLVALSAPALVHAHGGGLNADGCHTEKKTGNYHCHGSGSSSSGGGGGRPVPIPSQPAYSAPAPAPRRSEPNPVAPAIAGPATLISVGDGDTIRVTAANGQKVTIRMACIDAPETAQGESGAAATQTLKQLLSVGSLEIRPQTVDRYGRTVAEVFAGGRNVNLEMVRYGAAYAYREYLSGCDEGAYLGAEGQAERARWGVWRWGNEVKPWDFRRNQRGGG